MEELVSGQSNPEPEIRVSLNGPYFVANLTEFRNWLGGELPRKHEMELCRCGQSSNKPYCDGSHARANFSGAKDPKRVSDKRDAYRGNSWKSLTIAGFAFTSDSAQTGWRQSFMPGESPSLLPAGAGSTKSSRLSALVRLEHSVSELTAWRLAIRSISVGRRQSRFPRMGRTEFQVASDSSTNLETTCAQPTVLRGSTSAFAAAGTFKTSHFAAACIGM